MRIVAPLAGLAGLFPLSLAAQPAPILLDDVVLSADRVETAAARTGSAVSVLTGPEIAAAGSPFLLDAIGQVPGVATSRDGPPGSTSGFSIRGAGQRYVRVLVDGIDIADPTAPQVAASLSGLFAPDFGRIEVLKGSQSALWGGQAVGGVISLNSPRPERDGFSLGVRLEGGSHDTALASYRLGYRGARGEAMLTASGLTSSGFSAAEENDGNDEQDGVDAARLSLTGTFYATETVSLFGTLSRDYERGEFDAFGGPFGDNPDNVSQTRSTGARAGLSVTAGRITHTASLQRFEIDRNIYQFGSPFATEGSRTRLDYLADTRLSDRLALQFGADWTRETLTATSSQSSEVTGVFAQASLDPAPALSLTAALRLDEHSAFGSYPTGRLTAAYLVTPATTLRGSLGTGFRAPSPFELFDPFSGNPDLEPETSLSWDLGVEHRLADGRGRLSASVFRLEIADLIDYVGVFLPPDFNCTGPCSYVGIPGTSTAEGMELSAELALSRRWQMLAGYTYTDAREADGTRRNRVPRHDVALTLSAAPTERLDVALTARFRGDVVDDSTPLQPGQFDGIGDHTVLDLRLGYDITDQAEVYMRVQNLLDVEYQTSRGYGTSDRAVFAGLAARF